MDGDGGDDGSLLSFDDPDDVLDDVGGAHDDVALGDGGAHVGDALCLHVFVDACGWTPCLMMAWSHDAYSVMVVTWMVEPDYAPDGDMT